MKNRLNDKWFRLLGIPVIALMGHITFFNRNHTGEERFGFWGIYIISLLESYTLWEVIRIVLMYFRQKYPGLGNSKQRIASLLVAGTIATIVVRSITLYFYDKTQFWGYAFPLEGYLYNIFVALLYVVIIGGIYEAIYYFKQWKKITIEAEALRNENLQTQLESLKAQINPHFLFNSLSSLSSLIHEDPNQAAKFVEELSSVYRYLLQTNDKELATIEEELHFLNAYSVLLKTRFQDGLNIKVDVDDEYRKDLVPPLSLQLLVENAVKHNVILPQSPLEVRIIAEDGMLKVFNNIQKKSSQAYSSRLGLENIRAKYKLMKHGEVHVLECDNTFHVSIPLIKAATYANSDH